MLTVTRSNLSLAANHAPLDSALLPFVSRLYTRSLDALRLSPNTLQGVLKQELCELLPLTGLNVTAVVQIRAEKPSEERRQPEFKIIEWAVGNYRDGNLLDAVKVGTEWPSKRGEAWVTMEDVIDKTEEMLLASVASVRPNCRHVFGHWLLFEAERVAFCLFRAPCSASEPGAFTAEERSLLDKVAPHLARLTSLEQILKMQRSSYETFARRTIEIAIKYDLTATEERVLHRLVTGVDNASIAIDMRIGVATVKTHINHILQKTGCRNRNDLLGRYFSSIFTVL